MESPQYKQYYNKKMQNIGWLRDGVFKKRVKKHRHLMKMNDAWGIDYDTLVELKQDGCTEMRILDQDENKVYSVPFSDFFGKATTMDWGDGNQAFLPRSEWSVEQL